MFTHDAFSERPVVRKLRDGQVVLIRRLSAKERIDLAEAAQKRIAEVAKSASASDVDKLRANQLAECELVAGGALRSRWWGLLPPVPAFESAEEVLAKLSIERIDEVAGLIAQVNGIQPEGASPNP